MLQVSMKKSNSHYREIHVGDCMCARAQLFMTVSLRQSDEGKKLIHINRKILRNRASEIFPHHLEGLMHIHKMNLYDS